jgi:hypothetical protein
MLLTEVENVEEYHNIKVSNISFCVDITKKNSKLHSPTNRRQIKHKGNLLSLIPVPLVIQNSIENTTSNIHKIITFSGVFQC